MQTCANLSKVYVPVFEVRRSVAIFENKSESFALFDFEMIENLVASLRLGEGGVIWSRPCQERSTRRQRAAQRRCARKSREEEGEWLCGRGSGPGNHTEAAGFRQQRKWFDLRSYIFESFFLI